MLNIVIVWYAILSVPAANTAFTENEFNDITRTGDAYIALIDETIHSAVELFTHSLELGDYRERFSRKFHVEALKAINEISTRVLEEHGYGSVLTTRQCINNAMSKIVANEAKIRDCITEFAKSINPVYDNTRDLMDETIQTLERIKKQAIACTQTHPDVKNALYRCIMPLLKQVGATYGPLSISQHYNNPLQFEDAQARYESGYVICTNEFDIGNPESEIKPIVYEYSKCMRKKITRN